MSHFLDLLGTAYLAMSIATSLVTLTSKSKLAFKRVKIIFAHDAVFPPFWSETPSTQTIHNNTSLITFCYFFSFHKMLLVSPCDEDQYQCFDGSCIPLWSFCDNTVDCQDGTDEGDCRKWNTLTIKVPTWCIELQYTIISIFLFTRTSNIHVWTFVHNNAYSLYLWM